MFCTAGDRLAFLRLLAEASGKHGMHIHGYVLMSNHVHLLATGLEPGSIGRAVQSVGRRYVPRVNRLWGRVGSLWQARHRANAVESRQYAMNVMRYIELNPVRAGMCARATDFIWSSHLHHAYGKPDDLLVPHTAYAALAPDPEARQRTYAASFEEGLSAEMLERIRDCVKSGEPLGDEDFLAELEAFTGRRVLRRRTGRPKISLPNPRVLRPQELLAQ
jgi:putative transposase